MILIAYDISNDGLRGIELVYPFMCYAMIMHKCDNIDHTIIASLPLSRIVLMMAGFIIVRIKSTFDSKLSDIKTNPNITKKLPEKSTHS